MLILGVKIHQIIVTRVIQINNIIELNNRKVVSPFLLLEQCINEWRKEPIKTFLYNDNIFEV